MADRPVIKMSCPICYEAYDDHVEARRCYNICENQGHTICKTCVTSYTQQVCPECRGPRRRQPVLTRVNNEPAADPMELEEAQPAGPPVVLLIDISGSMQQESGPQQGAPARVELGVHMAKILLAFCRKLKIRCAVYTFSEGVTKIPVDEKMSPAEAHRIMDKIRPDGQTNLGLALGRLFNDHGPSGKYFILTDGEPTDEYAENVSKFAQTQLHLFAFGKGVNTDLLQAIGTGPLHSISYIQDVASISGYMVPIFICAVTEMKRVTLNEIDEECRQRFVRTLKPQIRGSTATYKMADLVTTVQGFHPRATTTYSRDLEVDTIGLPAHGRIAHSFDPKNWHGFGKFYIPCILHCHEYLIAGNAFDPSLKHYRTPEYQVIFAKIADVPITVDFSAFMAPAAQQEAVAAAASVVVQKSYQSMDTYSYSSSAGDDGCIGPDAQVRVLRTAHKDGYGGTRPMKDVMPGDVLEQGPIKWILRISNLNHGNPIPLFNGLTPSHPVRGPDGTWIKAKHYPDARVTYTTDIVYDVILEDSTLGAMKVNGIDVAVVGYPVPGMVHPYWGSQKVVEDVRSHYPDGGFVDVDAKQFKYTNGLVSSLFDDE